MRLHEILGTEAETAGMKPLAELRPCDPRTFVRNGGIPDHLRNIYFCLLSARRNVPPLPHESDIIQDRMLANDLDLAFEKLLAVAQALGVDLTDYPWPE